MTTVDANTFTYYAFNATPTFNQTNARIQIAPGDSLYISVVNTDVIEHGFNITNTVGYGTTIPAGDTVTIPTLFSDFGAHIFYDSLNYPTFRYMGLGGMIVVDATNYSSFYWNIKTHLGIWNDSLENGYTVDWSTYYPDYYTINGNSNPDINADADAKVVGNVGDTIRIYIANTGQSIHSLHFHGYHLTILNADIHQAHVGRSKDTFPIKSMEVLILELVPDKPGEYPVHDHNLVAVTGGGMYPNGMVLTMLIQ